MSHFKFVGLDNEFAAVPVGGGGFEGKPISGESDGEDHPSRDVIDQIIFACNHF